MKAQCFAVLLSLCVVSLPGQASEGQKHTVPTPQTTATHNPIDLNKADVTSLTGSIKGIGKKRAEAIVAYRESHHGFKSIEELAEVKGIGQHFLSVNKDHLKEVFVVH
jgi:competence protein ComEA